MAQVNKELMESMCFFIPYAEMFLTYSGSDGWIILLHSIIFRRNQNAGAISGFWLIAMDDQMFVNFRAIIRECMLSSGQSNVRIRDKPLPVSVFEYFVE